jgi:hypothetical protein
MTANMANSEDWLYSIGDDSKPGEYAYIDGYILCCEGSDRLNPDEIPAVAGQELANCLGCCIAHVSKDGSGERKVVGLYSPIQSLDVLT